MRLSGKHILLISPEPWEGLHMSKHHVAEGLVAKGNVVCFMGPPDRGRGIRLTGEGALRILHYRHWFTGISRAPRWLHNRYYARLIERSERLAGRRFDMIWCFDTSRMREFPTDDRFHLLQLVDLDITHQGHGLMRTAHFVATTTTPILDKVKAIAPHVPARNVGHALDERWLAAAALETRQPRAPKLVVYAGQFYNTYMHWAALLTIARRHPALHFRFIGPWKEHLIDPDHRLLRSLPNVEFTGLVSKDRLVPMVHEADLLLFSFKSDEVGEQCANPHKVLEYLSTGNVTVGTWTMEYAERQDLIEMAPLQAGLPDCFDRALEHFDGLNAPERRSARIAYARERTVGRLLARIEAAIAAIPARP